jgi:predicted nucleic acid-binding protein
LTALILDAEALSLLARGGPHEHTVRAALVAALAEATDVVVPAAVLAELYRGRGHDQAIDACLAREGGIAVAPTDRTLARRIGHLLVAAGRGSAHHVDAAVVAVCAATGGGVVLTGDTTDLWVLAGGSPGVTIRGIK